ncbi:MAG: hypothetical protein LUC36_04960, partial [Oscillospiraceae bacterium]|nr:hypothetical protein [Oscillospiraceae bacterium]
DNSSQIWSASHVTLSMFNQSEAADAPEATAASAQSDNITISIYDYVMTKDEYTLLSYLTSSIDIVQINSLISCDLDNDGNDDIVVFFSGETTDGDISHTLVGAIFSDGFGGALDIASDRQWCFEGDFSVNGETATCTIADPYSEAQITDEISFYHYYEGDECFNVVIKTVDETVAG